MTRAIETLNLWASKDNNRSWQMWSEFLGVVIEVKEGDNHTRRLVSYDVIKNSIFDDLNMSVQLICKQLEDYAKRS